MRDPRERPIHCHHEKRRDRRRGRVRRRHRPDATSAATASTRPSIRRARRLGWHDVASRLRGPAVGDVAAHFAMRWRGGRPASAWRRAAAARPAGEHRCRSSARSPRTCTTACPRGDFRILEAYLRALRSAQRARLPREPVPVVAGDRRRSSPTSSAARRPTTSASSSCCPRKANNGAGRHPRPARASSPTPTTGAGGFLAATIRARTGDARDPCTCTPRSASSTTAG